MDIAQRLRPIPSDGHSLHDERKLSPPLCIWHIGAGGSPESVNGVNTAIWRIASAQSALGHHIHLAVPATGNPESAVTPGITRHVVPAGRFWLYPKSLLSLLEAAIPDIVHIHSAFVPRHTLLGGVLRRARHPYVVTPHGGLLPQVLERSRSKKFAYSLLFEKSFVRGASGITGITQHELECVVDFIKPASVPGRSILNPVAQNEDLAWAPRSGRPSILFLGRFDVETKGLDRLLEIARRIPGADFNLYGRSHSDRDDVVLRSAPPNVSIHRPVYGSAKAQVLQRATVYLQPSRWEAFSISVAEALAAGVPCALTETLHQARILCGEAAAWPLPEDPAAAARRLQQLLADSEALLTLSRTGRRFAREHLAAERVAQAYIDFYRELLGERRWTMETECRLDHSAVGN